MSGFAYPTLSVKTFLIIPLTISCVMIFNFLKSNFLISPSQSIFQEINMVMNYVLHCVTFMRMEQTYLSAGPLHSNLPHSRMATCLTFLTLAPSMKRSTDTLQIFIKINICMCVINNEYHGLGDDFLGR